MYIYDKGGHVSLIYWTSTRACGNLAKSLECRDAKWEKPERRFGMKLLIFLLGAAMIATLFTACGATEETDSSASEPVSSNNGEVSPEMEDFISGFNGTYEAVEAALADYGATDDIVNHDMGMYNLEEAEIIGSDGNCYSFVSQSGVFKNTYEVCWEGGKIVSITGG